MCIGYELERELWDLHTGVQCPQRMLVCQYCHFAQPRTNGFEEWDGLKLPCYRGDNINADAFGAKSRLPYPHRMKNVYPQAAATLNLLRASATGGYVAMQRVAQWNFDFSEHSEQSDGHMELAHRVAGVGLVGTDFGTGLVLIWSGLGVAAGLVLIWSGLGVAAGLVTSGLGAVTGGQDNFTNFV
jgi:hypothetical protein